MRMMVLNGNSPSNAETGKIQTIIIQAGGRGTRMGHYTSNKPKALLSVDGLPILWHLFRLFPDKAYIIIGDYKFDVLSRYINNFYNGKYILIKSNGVGTCSGLKQAFSYLREGEPFILIWSDIVLPSSFNLNGIDLNQNYIGISKNFMCRWSFVNGQFREEKSCEFGVAGFFIFNNKNLLTDVPDEGEFVKYLSNKRNIRFIQLPLYGAREFGSKEVYEKYELYRPQTRPFNRLIIEKDRVIKEPLDVQGKKLANLESNWYEFVNRHNFENIPKIFSFAPLVMEKLDGRHPFDFVSDEEKEKVLINILDGLKRLHALASPIDGDIFSSKREYVDKTFERLRQVKDVIPFADKIELKVNGKICKNPIFYREKIEEIAKNFFERTFYVIHGDITFSNILICEGLNPKFIDPRGYFGFREIYGDKDYDYAKLYYSVHGNYDKFNRRRFKVNVYNDDISLEIDSNGWEKYRNYFFENIGIKMLDKIEFLHAIIWLSLTSYAWDDYDSIIGAYYRGVELMRRFL